MIAGNSPPLFQLSINADRLALMVCLLEGFRVYRCMLIAQLTLGVSEGVLGHRAQF
jgi:hypothetical protein